MYICPIHTVTYINTANLLKNNCSCEKYILKSRKCLIFVLILFVTHRKYNSCKWCSTMHVWLFMLIIRKSVYLFSIDNQIIKKISSFCLIFCREKQESTKGSWTKSWIENKETQLIKEKTTTLVNFSGFNNFLKCI